MVPAGDGTEYYVEFLSITDRAAASVTPGMTGLLDALDGGRAAFRVMLRASDAGAVRDSLSAAGVSASEATVSRSDGSAIGTVFRLPADTGAGCEVGVIVYEQSIHLRVEGHQDAGRFNHGFPLSRLDHLAAFTPDPDATCAWWHRALGVGVFGEVRGRGMVIRQLKMGDAIFEVLGPDGPDSPMAARPGGLASMCAFEVPDLSDAVEIARARGFTAPDPADGVLPGTRTSTVPPAELGGLALQLLEYV
jgi:catechol 2,3-dioxygenase-like lactoylglutathione lyase family enzyme